MLKWFRKSISKLRKSWINVFPLGKKNNESSAPNITIDIKLKKIPIKYRAIYL